MNPRGAQLRHATEEPPQQKLLTRGEAAALLGISRSEFKRREADGKYIATYVDRNNGWHFYSIEYLSTLPGYGRYPNERRKRLTAPEKVTQYRPPISETDSAIIPSNFPSRTPGKDPKITAKLFEAFDNNIDASEIVKQLLIDPDVVTTTYAAWMRMKTIKGGGIQLSAADLDVINNELGSLPGTYPVTSAEQLISNLREAARDAPTCTSCKTQACRLCHSCAQTLYATEQVAIAPTPKRMGRPRKSA